RRAATVAALRRTMEEKDATIACLVELQAQTSKAAGVSDARHAELEAELERRAETIAGLRRTMAEKDVAISRPIQDAAVRHQIAGEERLATIERLTQELHRRDAEVREPQTYLA